MKKTYKDQEQAQKRKNIAKWVFAGIGWTLLLGLFILLTTLGVRGCVDRQNRQKEQATALNLNAPQVKKSADLSAYNVLYECLYNGETSVTSQSLLDMARYLGYDSSYSSSQPDIELVEYYHGDLAYYQNGEFTNLYRSRVILKCMDNYSGGPWYYRVDSFTLYDNYDRPQYAYLAQTHPYLINNTSVMFYNNGSIVLSNDYVVEDTNIYLALLHPFYASNPFSPVSYTFNEQINYNAPLGYQASLSYFPLDNGLSWYRDWQLGKFLSGGQIFDTIRFVYGSTGSVYMYVEGATEPQLVPSGNSYFEVMYYMNSVTGTQVSVNWRNQINYKHGSGYTNAILNSSTWTSNNYRRITFLDNISEEDITRISSLNNNNSLIGGGSVSSGDVSGIFDLLGRAFGTWADIFNMTLLPGLSIGVFVFLPLVVSVIVLVFKAVKK